MTMTDVTIPTQYVLVQGTQPTSPFVGLLWVDNSGASPLTYVWDGSSFVLVTQDYSSDISALQTAVNTTLPATIGFKLISSQVLTGTADNITFTSFPAGYKAFRLVYNLKANSAMNTLTCVLNADTAAGHYANGYNWIAGTTNTTATETNAGINLSNYNGADNSYQMGFCDIDNSTTLANKGFSVAMVNTTNNSSINRGYWGVGFWISNADITSIAVKTASANGFRIGSTATLWGLK